jgi:hypothetical protein
MDERNMNMKDWQNYDKGKQRYLEKNSQLHFIYSLAWDWTHTSTVTDL